MKYVANRLEKMLNEELKKRKIKGKISICSLSEGLSLFYIKEGVKYFFYFPFEPEIESEDWITYVIDPEEIIDWISKRVEKINPFYIG